MKIYINGIDNGQGEVSKGKRFIEVRYESDNRPVYYAMTKCLFANRFGERCMIYGGDYSEEDITEINENYQKYMRSK